MKVSKFICQNCECGQLLPINGIKEHSRNCKFISAEQNQFSKIVDDNFGECEFCHKTVNNPKTKHLYITYFKPSECELLRSKCPNCNLKNVIIKDHFKRCPMKPKECDLEKLGCKGWLLADMTECMLANNHREILENSVKGITVEIENFKTVEKITSYKIKEIEKIIQKVSCLKEAIMIIRTTYQNPRCGKLIWKIDNALTFLQETKPKYSSPIYTSDHGYKLCLKAYPNGEGIGKDNYFSLFFVIMRGNYDDLLPWPFSLKVRILLYNKNMHFLSRSEIYKPDGNMISFHKPCSDFNIAVGNPEFIELINLRNNGFIEDDILSIGLCVQK